MKCVKCGREHDDYHFRVLQVQTLHVRDLNREKRVQALGGFEEYSVCASCAREKQHRIMDTRSQVLKSSLIFGILTILGLLLCLLYWQKAPMLRMSGLGLAIGSGLYLCGKIRVITAHKRKLLPLSPEDALYHCAWESMLDAAPRKNDINDITYIPVDEQTLARKNGDLMILYDLLPEIAIEAHKRIHGQDTAPADAEEA